jgi:acetyltransferase-like isoleucine patch superfamily enzyme
MNASDSPLRRPFGRRHLALSQGWYARTLRFLRRAVRNLSIPAPAVITRPILWAVLALRNVYFWCRRVFVCEPLFKAYCKSYGRNLHTDIYLHWVMGDGDVIIGDDVKLDGKSTICFAARFSERPLLSIGSNTGIGHGCIFTIAKSIRIGRDCRIASQVMMFDSPGHPADPDARRRGEPPRDEDVRPIVISDNVWIGRRAVISPGITVGENSVVAVGAVVVADVPPNTTVAGNPARKISTTGA